MSEEIQNISKIGLIKKSQVYALVSFIIGSIFFGLFCWTENINIAVYGLFFVIIAILVNGIFISKLIIKLISKNVDKKKYLISIVFLMLNIPVVIIYYKIVSNIIRANMEML